jgi:hypothetical protein
LLWVRHKLTGDVRPYDRKIAIFERGMGPIPDARSVFRQLRRVQLAKGSRWGARIGLGSAPSGECPLTCHCHVARFTQRFSKVQKGETPPRQHRRAIAGIPAHDVETWIVWTFERNSRWMIIRKFIARTSGRKSQAIGRPVHPNCRF